MNLENSVINLSSSKKSLYCLGLSIACVVCTVPSAFKALEKAHYIGKHTNPITKNEKKELAGYLLLTTTTALGAVGALLYANRYADEALNERINNK